MWSKFAKNGILTGQVDTYCLVCECHIKSLEIAWSHVDEPGHVKKLTAVGYFEKYKSDYIRKVKNGYFCGFCNLLVPTAAKVGLHINENDHNDRKGSNLLKRWNNDVVAFDNLLIKEDAWHGLIEDTCLICNAEFDEKDVHKAENVHAVKLTQNKVMFGPGRSVYRKIDESSYQCLTCNNVFATDSFDDHINSADHEIAHKQSNIDEKHASNIAINSVDKSKTDFIILTNNEQKSDMAKSDTDKNKDHKTPNNNKKNETLTNSIGNQNGTMSSQDTKNEKEVNLDEVYCKALGAKNYIIELEDATQLCIVCHCNLNTSAAVHLSTEHHQKMLELHKERVEKNKKSKEPKISENADTSKQTKANTQPESKVKQPKKPHKNGLSEADNKSKILDSVSTFQKNEVNIDFITETAYCKKCTTNIDFDYNAINNHIDGHKSDKKENKKVPFESGVNANGTNTNLYTKPVFLSKDRESPSSDDDMNKLAQENGMIKRTGNNKLYCKTCDSEMPANVKNLKEHISGSKHKSKTNVLAQALVKKTPAKQLTKQRMTDFVKDISSVEDDDGKDVIINEKICIPASNLLFIGKALMTGVGCIACNTKLDVITIEAHIDSSTHKEIVEKSEIITSLDSEFVREIYKKGGYHCGFCNHAEDDWDSMEEHLSSFDHTRTKTQAGWRLQEHLRDLKEHRARKQLEFSMFMHMFMANNMFMPPFMPNMFRRRNAYDSDSD